MSQDAWKREKDEKQAGAELCQAQVKLGVKVYIGVRVDMKKMRNTKNMEKLKI